MGQNDQKSQDTSNAQDVRWFTGEKGETVALSGAAIFARNAQAAISPDLDVQLGTSRSYERTRIEVFASTGFDEECQVVFWLPDPSEYLDDSVRETLVKAARAIAAAHEQILGVVLVCEADQYDETAAPVVRRQGRPFYCDCR